MTPKPITATPKPATDPVLQDFKSAIVSLYGSQLDRVILYGSRARGDHRADSDYDIAVFLKHYDGDRWTESGRISSESAKFLRSHDAFIHAMPYLADRYNATSPLMGEIRREGIKL
jgi:uncharacterized protein